jgi:hypothetical protein
MALVIFILSISLLVALCVAFRAVISNRSRAPIKRDAALFRALRERAVAEGGGSFAFKGTTFHVHLQHQHNAADRSQPEVWADHIN